MSQFQPPPEPGESGQEQFPPWAHPPSLPLAQQPDVLTDPQFYLPFPTPPQPPLFPQPPPRNHVRRTRRLALILVLIMAIIIALVILGAFALNTTSGTPTLSPADHEATATLLHGTLSFEPMVAAHYPL